MIINIIFCCFEEKKKNVKDICYQEECFDKFVIKNNVRKILD